MKIKLFQIDPETDANNLLFMNYEWAMSHGGIHQDSYKLVFDGDVDAKTLEDIFRIFNLELPKGYRGRSMSVSDVVWAEGFGTFFCDSFGFKQLKKFNGNKCSWMCSELNEKEEK